MRLAAGKRSRLEAFTLVELVISAALMAMILGAGYACLQAGVSAQRLMEPRLDAAQGARVALGILSADLRAACALAPRQEFLGMDRSLEGIEADNLDFATHHHTPRGPGEGDYCQLSYYLQPSSRAGLQDLWRRRNPRIGLDPLEGGQEELMATGVRGFQLEYYDGLEWFDTWGDVEGRGEEGESRGTAPNAGGLPVAVRVTLSVDPTLPPRGGGAGGVGQAQGIGSEASREPPLVFQTTVYLALAGREMPSGGSSSAGAGGEPNPTGTSAAPMPSPIPGSF